MELPRVTFAMMAYNDEKFVGETVDSVLAQDYPALDIVISDDCSEDSTWSIIQARVAAYTGPHRVEIVRQPRNLYMGHYKALWPLVRNDFCVFTSGDDVSPPHRTRTLVEHHLSTGALVVSSNARLIDEVGRELGTHHPLDIPVDLSLEAFSRTGYNPACFGAGISWHRSIFDYFGPLHPTVRNADELIPFRGMVLGTIAYLADPLVDWRQHAGTMTLSKKLERATSDVERVLIEERRLNNKVANRYAMLVDLKTHVDRAGRSDRLNSVRLNLLNQLMQHVEQWLLLRAEMAHSGIGIR